MRVRGVGLGLALCTTLGCSDSGQPPGNSSRDAAAHDGGELGASENEAAAGATTHSSGAGLSGGASATAALAPVAESDLAEALAAAACDGLGPCCAAMDFEFDEARCREAKQRYAQYGLPITNPRYRYDPMQAARCVAASRELAALCGKPDLFYPDHEVAQEGPCANVYVGIVPEGGACRASGECEGGLINGARCVDGSCRMRPRGQLGDTCSATCENDGESLGCHDRNYPIDGALCYLSDRLFCDRECIAIAEEGEDCGLRSPWEGCEPGTVCDTNPTSGPSHICRLRAPVGGLCDPGGCVEGASCDGEVCRPTRAPGEACEDGFDCVGPCLSGTCSPYRLATALTEDYCRGLTP